MPARTNPVHAVGDGLGVGHRRLDLSDSAVRAARADGARAAQKSATLRAHRHHRVVIRWVARLESRPLDRWRCSTPCVFGRIRIKPLHFHFHRAHAVDTTLAQDPRPQNFWLLAIVACSNLWPTPYGDSGNWIWRGRAWHYRRFMLASIIGRAVRFFAVTYALVFFGKRAERFLSPVKPVAGSHRLVGASAACGVCAHSAGQLHHR